MRHPPLPATRPLPGPRHLLATHPLPATRSLRLWLSIASAVLFLLPPALHAQAAEPATLRVAVLSLFHPQTLLLTTSGQPLQITRTPDNLLDLTQRDGTHRVLPLLRLAPGDQTLHVQGTRTALTRTYRGALALTASAGELRPVVTMDTETAVSSVVAAEAPPDAPPEALRAQAIAARSFLLSNLHPHAAADTCDTTHCQLLREPPPPGSPAAEATRATSHLVLAWQPDPASPPRLVPAQWTPACAGPTLAGHPRTPADYPFYPVACLFCQTHPTRWQLSPGTPIPAGERAREVWNRTHPTRQIPSTHIGPGGHGQGSGHGIGLCQRGAFALATQGQGFREILAHFYPNTRLIRLP